MLLCFGLIFLLNLLGFLVAFFLQTDKLTDITYALSFLASSAMALAMGAASDIQILIFSLQFLWAIRIGLYLFTRVHSMKRDQRFDDFRNSFTGFGAFWLLQAGSVCLINAPVLLLLGKNSADLGPMDSQWIFIFTILSSLVFLSALIYETVADYQKYRFRQNPDNNGRFCNTGLWAHSQHPNYAGEILCWLSLSLLCFPWLQGPEYLGLVSPLWITFLLLKISGIPLLQKSSMARYGHLEDFRLYTQQTPLLIPNLSGKLPQSK